MRLADALVESKASRAAVIETERRLRTVRAAKSAILTARIGAVEQEEFGRGSRP